MYVFLLILRAEKLALRETKGCYHLERIFPVFGPRQASMQPDESFGSHSPGNGGACSCAGCFHFADHAKNPSLCPHVFSLPFIHWKKG